jgi:putative intracellular protease/amidase
MKSICRLLSLFFFILALSGVSSSSAVAAPSKRVAILLFDGVDIIDFAAPYDVFVNAEIDVVTVSRDGKPVTTQGGMKVVPQYSYSDVPGADAVLIPGGDTHTVQRDPSTMDWLKQRYGTGELLMSVCNGAFTLANTGLLKGLKATTTSGNIDALRRAYPQLDVVRNLRVVDNGRILTTGGLSAGIDGALQLVSRLKGLGRAQFVATVMEYNWQPEGSFLPALSAFHIMHQTVSDADLGGLGKVETLVSTGGDTRQWSYVWRVQSSLDSDALAEHIDRTLAEERRQMNMNPPFAASPGHRRTFVDGEGQAWLETLEVNAVPGKPGLHTVRLGIKKSS